MIVKALFLSILTARSAAFDFGFPFYRGGAEVGQDFSCSVAGAGGETSCDASQATDGSQCVWCSLGDAFGVCVSETQATAMKKAIPGLTCDDDGNTDDDAIPNDDDATTDDDVVPPAYWKCLKDFTDANTCDAGGCTWCTSKAGFGICLDKAAASKANDSDWFECDVDAVLSPTDPYDTSCLLASLQQDEAACEATVDSEGSSCEWCTLSSTNLCLNKEQSAMIEQIGGDCSNADTAFTDPYDTSCLQASLAGDEATCKATVDSDGKACEWCSLSSTDLCLNEEQAMVVEQFGGDCSEAFEVLTTATA